MSDHHGIDPKHHPGFQTTSLPNVPYKSKKTCEALCITYFSCAFHGYPLPIMSPIYLTSVVSCSVCPKRVGYFRLLKSLFLVNGTLTIFCGLIDSWVLSQHYCTVLKASCRSSEMVFGNLILMRRAMSSASPRVWQSFPLSPVNSSTTRLQSRGAKAFPWPQKPPEFLLWG
jgi:hypothetical protein